MHVAYIISKYELVADQHAIWTLEHPPIIFLLQHQPHRVMETYKKLSFSIKLHVATDWELPLW